MTNSSSDYRLRSYDTQNPLPSLRLEPVSGTPDGYLRAEIEDLNDERWLIWLILNKPVKLNDLNPRDPPVSK